ncbi:MAG: hypothetical protein ABR907_10020 [Terracidiphilus sp.]|jgi:hypothetical protein
MDELFFTLLLGVAEVFFDFLFEMICEAIVVLIVRSLRSLFSGSHAIQPALAAFGYFLLGTAFGILSVFLFPHPLVHKTIFHGVSLIVTPIIVGFVMSYAGKLLRRSGKQSIRIESFGYGFIFALGMAVIRFVFVH